MGKASRAEPDVVFFAIGLIPFHSASLPKHPLVGGEARTHGCGLPSYTREVVLAFIQTRMKDFTHIPQLPVKGHASKCPEGSASPFLRRANPQYLSSSNTFGKDFRIQAQLLSPFVCKCPTKLSWLG